VFDKLTNGQAVMHYGRHRLTASVAYVTTLSLLTHWSAGPSRLRKRKVFPGCRDVYGLAVANIKCTIVCHLKKPNSNISPQTGSTTTRILSPGPAVAFAVFVGQFVKN